MAQTIADLNESNTVDVKCISEALQYRLNNLDSDFAL